LKFLIAGLGSIGRRHLRNLRTLGETDILLYRTHQSTIPDVELADYPAHTDLQAALSEYPDAVIVSNPTALHLDIALPAAEAGCHLLLEKPISHNMDRVSTLMKIVNDQNLQVLVGYQFRFHPGLRKIKSLLSDNQIGRPLSFRAHWGEYLPTWHPWEDYRQSYSARRELGGGVTLTLSHPLDYLHWLIGEVEEIWAFTAQQSDLELDVEDSAEIGLRFKNGVIGSLHVNYTQRPPSHQLEIVGTQGTIQWELASGATKHYQPHEEIWETYSPPPGFERNALFLDEMRHFINLAKGRVTPLCSLADGKYALELALGAISSAGKGKMVKPSGFD
jgi:predicted dehydrogenase